MSRHSFASVIALANNVSLPNVAKMLGHSSTRMTQHYAKVLDQTILRDMQEVEKQINNLHRQLYTILHNKIRVQPLLLLLWLQIY